MVKFFKALLLVIATAIMAVCLIAVPESSGTISVTYISVLGVYLALDMAGMIAKTATLPKGEFKELNKYKYIVAAVCLVSLIVTCLVVKSKGYDVSTALTSFISSVMVLVALVIGGLEGNNIATEKGEAVSDS